MTGGRAVTQPERLVVGHLAKPHGNRGELLVWPLTDRPVEVFAPGRALLLGDEEGRVAAAAPTVVVEGARPFKRGLLLKLVGVDARAAAESLAGRYLLASFADLEPLADGEVFYHQLLGAAVETTDGTPVGTVREVFETEPAHLLEVEAPGGKRRLIPFTQRVVRSVEPETKRIVIEPPAGLLDL